jgi:hydroxyacylglutathione hydrolase
MPLTLHALPALADNYIWLLVDEAGRAVIVDPGEAGPVFDAAAHGITPVALLLTHHHLDHIGGVAAIRERWRLPCFAPDDPRIPDADERVGEGDRIDIPALGLQFDVMATPGHTLSHIIFHGHGHLFCGDTLFSLGCGRLFEGTPAQMLDSLDRIAALPGEYQVCCAHEYTLDNARFARAVDFDNPALDVRLAQAIELRNQGLPSLPTTLASEREANPFLNADRPQIRQRLAERDGCGAADRLEAFTRLREWKDTFRA